MARVYLALCILGTVVPCSFFLPWVFENGISIPLLLSEIFSTRIGAFFGADVLISAAVLLMLIMTDGSKQGVSSLWLPIVGTVCVGVSCGLPLYLYLRERNVCPETWAAALERNSSLCRCMFLSTYGGKKSVFAVSCLCATFLAIELRRIS